MRSDDSDRVDASVMNVLLLISLIIWEKAKFSHIIG